MSTHAELDDLALYALGCAEAPVRARIAAHVERCAVCRNELQRLYSDMGSLAMMAPDAEPGGAVKRRLMSSIAAARKNAEDRTEAQAETRAEGHARANAEVQAGFGVGIRAGIQTGLQTGEYAEHPLGGAERKRERGVNWWWLIAPVAASLVLAVMAGTLFVRNQNLSAEIQSARQQLASTRSQAEAAEQVVATINASDAVRITLVKAATKAQPQLQTIYSREQRRILLVANNLEALTPGKGYELWLLPAAKGEAPVAAGVFHPDSKGNAYHTYVLPSTMEAKGFAITVENDAGVAAPTSTPIFVGLQS